MQSLQEKSFWKWEVGTGAEKAIKWWQKEAVEFADGITEVLASAGLAKASA